MKILILLIPIVISVDPLLVVDTLNYFYSEISGNNATLYSLISSLYPANFSLEYDPEMILLLNNTYKGLSLHCLEVNSSKTYPTIIKHTVPEFKFDSAAVNYISEALLNYLNSDLSVPLFSVFTQNITKEDIFVTN